MNSRKFRGLFGISISILFACAVGSIARAAVLVYEGFNYSGKLINDDLSGQNGGVGWSEAWRTPLSVSGFPIAADSLHPPAAVIPPTGGRVDQSGNYSAQRAIGTLTIERGQSLWFSAEMATSGEAGGIRVGFNTPYSYLMWLQTASPGTDLPVRWDFLPTVDYGPPVVPGAPTLVVAEIYRDATDQFRFTYWINPSPPDGTGRPPESPAVTTTGYYGIGYATITGVTLISRGASSQFDEIRIGETYADVNGNLGVAIVTSASPVAGGSTSGSGAYSAGATVTVVATPNPGYSFINWTEGGTPASVSASYTFTAIADRTLVANFGRISSLTISCPPSISVECPAVPPAATNISTFITQGGTVRADTNCLPITLTVTETIANDCPKVITRTYQAADACGAHAECSQIITVTDTTKPIIGDAPPDLSLECDGTTPPLVEPTATDNCDPSPQVLLHEDITYSCGKEYTLVRSWHAVDHCGNVSERTVRQTIKVHDTTPPFVVVQMATKLFPAPGMAFDSGLESEVVFSAPEKKIRRLRVTSFTLASPPPLVGDVVTFSMGANAKFDFSNDGGTTWRACNAPCLATFRMQTSDTGDTVTFETELLQLDISGGTLPSGLRLRESPSRASMGSITIWTVAEGFELAGLIDANLELSVDDGVSYFAATGPLRLNAVPNLDRIVNVDNAAAYDEAVALQPVFVDACEGPVSPAPPTVTTVADCLGRSLERRWVAEDACHNVSEPFVQRITVIDTTAPVITCPTNIMVITGPDTLVDFAATATDNMDPAPIVTYDHPQHSRFPMGTNIVTCWARDHCGNESECSFTVTVSAIGCTAATQQAYIKMQVGILSEFEDGFGQSLAIDGDTMVVGAPEEHGGGATGGGAINIFGRDSSGVWSWQKGFYLTVGHLGSQFGFSVAISDNTVVAGAPGINGGRGGVYVITRDGSSDWAQQGDYFAASNSEAGDTFGSSVAISGDTIVVGAPNEATNFRGVLNSDFAPASDNSAPYSGAAYVFVRDASGSWSQRAYLKASNSESADGFGSSVAIMGDTIVVGATGERSDFDGVENTSLITDHQLNNSKMEAGAAYVFGRNADGTWVQQAYLKSSRPTASRPPLGPGGMFGESVSISGERVVVVGAPYDDTSSEGIVGAAEVFARSGGLWHRESRIENPSRTAGFAESVGISGDTIVIGHLLDGTAGAGAAYTYIRGGSVWIQQAYFTASNPDGGDQFGRSVAISGSTIVVGAPREDSSFSGVQPVSGITTQQEDNSAMDSGAAYVFSIEDSPCASDDTFFVPSGGDLNIPFGALLGNDAHSRGRPIFFSSHDAATARGLIISDVGSPATALHLPSPPPLPPGAEDSFTYRISDGTHEAVGTVHLVTSEIPTAPPNKLEAQPPPPLGPGLLGGLTIVFNAPDAGVYTLERKSFDIPGTNSIEFSWGAVADATLTAPGFTTFVDVLSPGGALYRIRHLP